MERISTDVRPGATGVYRRRVAIAARMVAEGSGEARCAMEDDFHHFRVGLHAQDGVVTAVNTGPLRTPNTLCAAAGARLDELIGMALSPACAAVAQQTDQFQQCTHQLDLAGLGVAALALGRAWRVYDVEAPDRVEGRTSATLAVDGQVALRWELDGMTIDAPEPYSGRSLGAGFTRFTRSLDPEAAEAALVMRRGLFVAQGRAYADTSMLGAAGPVGGCWAWQPERMDTLRRQPENRRDFSDDGPGLLAGDGDWLRFTDQETMRAGGR